MHQDKVGGSTRRRWLRDVGLGGIAAAVASESVFADSSPPDLHRLELRAGKLTATVVDNHDGLAGQQQVARRERIPMAADGHGDLYCTVPFEERFNGYNGVARLRYGDSPSPFMPCASGQNCEFFFDQGEATFEPRWSDQPRFVAQTSSLQRLSEASARLTIQPGQRWGVLVESRFELLEPFYLDIEHAFTPTDISKISGAVLGVFWASYIQVPPATAFHFVSPGGQWQNIYSALAHARSGVIAPQTGPVGGQLARRQSGRQLLYGVAKTRYGNPFYCGNVHGQLLSFMFAPTEDVEIRFGFNASGGGPGVPAWDYQALVAQPQPGKRYAFKTRTVYKPFEGLDEALQQYRCWEGQGG